MEAAEKLRAQRRKAIDDLMKDDSEGDEKDEVEDEKLPNMEAVLA